MEFTGFVSLPETTRPPRSSRNASTSRSCQDRRVPILIGLFHPVLDTKGADDGLVARREKFAGAAAKMVSPLRSMTSHRIDALRTTGHTAKQPTEVAFQLAPARRIQTQPGQDGRQAARCTAPFARNNLPGRPIQQFQVVLDRHWQKSLVTAPLARFTRTRTDRVGRLVDRQRRQKAIGFLGRRRWRPLIDVFALARFTSGDLGRVLAQRFDSSLHRRVIARFKRFRHRSPDQI